MTKILFTVDTTTGSIQWAAAEQFFELEGKTYQLRDMEARQIEKIEDLSITAKILLSAVAGAIIQHLIDSGIKIDIIFATGSFIVKK